MYLLLKILVFSCWLAVSADFAMTIPGRIMALADVNNDRLTDLIVLQNNNDSLSIYTASSEGKAAFSLDPHELSLPALLLRSHSQTTYFILNVAPVDVDGDSLLDLIVSYVTNFTEFTRPFDSVVVNVIVFWGNGSGFHYAGMEALQLRQQPMLVDCNFDQRVDILGQTTNNQTLLCYCLSPGSSRNFTPQSFSKMEIAGVMETATSGFADVTGDLSPELVFGWWKTSDILELQVWSFQEGYWTLCSTYTVQNSESAAQLFPQKHDDSRKLLFGRSIFVDLDSDGRIDHLLPLCCFGTSRELELLIWSAAFEKDKPKDHRGACNLFDHHKISVSLQNPTDNSQWAILPTSGFVGDSDLTIRAGDYTLDGFPDLLVVLEHVNNSANKRENIVVVFENVPCKEVRTTNTNQTYAADPCAPWTRGFNVIWSPFVVNPLTPIKPHDSQAVAAAFIDLGEDGSLDIFVEDALLHDGSASTNFLLSDDSNDASFLRVQVFTAPVCGDECSRRQSEGSGIAMPGATVAFDTYDSDNGFVSGAVSQLSQLSYRSLMLPYVTFGLGRTANFVEQLKVGIPYSKHPVNRTWTQIIPNSRLYIIPVPPDDPNSWISRLYITPSKLILVSFCALMVVCVIILAIILTLHCREQRIDKLEKQQMQHKFNFDAM